MSKSKLAEKVAAKRAQRKPAAPPAPAAIPTAPPIATDEDLRVHAEKLARQLAQERQQNAAALAAERDRAQKAIDRAKALEDAQTKATLRSSILKAATEAGAVYPEDVADLAMVRHKFALTADGKVVREDNAAIDAAATIKSLLENKPGMVRSTVAPGGGTPARAAVDGVPTKLPPARDLNERLRNWAESQAQDAG